MFFVSLVLVYFVYSCFGFAKWANLSKISDGIYFYYAVFILLNDDVLAFNFFRVSYEPFFCYWFVTMFEPDVVPSVIAKTLSYFFYLISWRAKTLLARYLSYYRVNFDAFVVFLFGSLSWISSLGFGLGLDSELSLSKSTNLTGVYLTTKSV